MSAIDAFEASENDHFVVHITRDKDRNVRVNSIELVHADIRNRYSFRQGRSLGDVFVEPLAAALRDALTAFGKSERILALPDFRMTVPGLSLGGLRILSTKMEDGREAIMLRVREYVGAIKTAFRFDPAMPIETATVRERIAVEVLRDIVNPLLDILSIAKDAPPEVLENNSEAVSRQLRRMSTRQEELHFYTGLLKRYITGCRDDAEKLTNGAQPDRAKQLYNGH